MLITTDILIVGQGLAGSLLAYQLLTAGLDVQVIDDQWHSASSLAAAGLINPVTGQRLVKTRGLDQLLPTAQALYKKLSEQIGQPLHHPRPMLRLIRQTKEKEKLEQRLTDISYQGLLGKLISPDQLADNLIAPEGAFEQYRAGFVDLPCLMLHIREVLKQQNRLHSLQFQHADLTLGKTHLAFGPIRAQRLVFCEGYRGQENPWFRHLPFQPVKGEIMTLTSQQPLTDTILNAGHWLIPLDKHHYRLGSTYQHQPLNNEATEEGRQFLIRALGKLIKDHGPIEIIGHRAGVRPATRGTQPFLGPSEQNPRLHIFNGFGAKGSLLIPWYAERYAAFLQSREEIPPEADIRRFSRCHVDS